MRTGLRTTFTLALAAALMFAAVPVVPGGAATAWAEPVQSIPTPESPYPDPELAEWLEVAPETGTVGSAVEPTMDLWRDDMTDATPTHYYVWCADDGSKPAGENRDAAGIVRVTYPYLTQPVYNPVTIALYALRYNDSWLHTNNLADRDEFLLHARWLKNNMDAQGRYTYTFPIDRVQAPWHSAMAQGLAISTMLRAYSTTGDTSYIDASRKAFLPFLKDIKDGGVVSDGGNWLEEYPDGTHVLNGMLFAVFGLYDLERVTGDAQASALLDKATGHLAANLGLYESHGAVLYEVLPDRFSHPSYYHLQNRQLAVLAELVDNPVFAETSERWATRFRAYPAPVVNLTRERWFTWGGGGTIHGDINYLFRAYFPQKPYLAVRTASTASTATWRAGGTVPMGFSSGYHAHFDYVTPALTTDTRFRFYIQGTPSLAQFGCDYPVNQFGETTARIAHVNVQNAWAVNNPASPNGDGLADYVYIGYDLGGPDSYVNVRIVNAAGQVVASAPGRTAAGLQTKQWRGRWWKRFELRDATGKPLPDGIYRFVVTATLGGDTSSKSDFLFISNKLTPAPALGTRPKLTDVWATPTPFTPGGAYGVTHFGFTLSTPAWVTIKVFDYRGEIRTVVNNARMPAGRHYPLWNGRTATGAILPRGNYRYYVFASGGGMAPATSLATGIVGLR